MPRQPTSTAGNRSYTRPRKDQNLHSQLEINSASKFLLLRVRALSGQKFGTISRPLLKAAGVYGAPNLNDRVRITFLAFTRDIKNDKKLRQIKPTVKGKDNKGTDSGRCL